NSYTFEKRKIIYLFGIYFSYSKTILLLFILIITSILMFIYTDDEKILKKARKIIFEIKNNQTFQELYEIFDSLLNLDKKDFDTYVNDYEIRKKANRKILFVLSRIIIFIIIYYIFSHYFDLKNKYNQADIIKTNWDSFFISFINTMLVAIPILILLKYYRKRKSINN
ncbi:MAG: hypothetical protein ACOVQ2_10470, partial [Flavobacterium sp.]